MHQNEKAWMSSTRLAVLIDGDNAQPSQLDLIFAAIEQHGLVTVKRIYGDWTTQNMNGWKKYLSSHAIQPIQQFQYSTGKNSTDGALIIDAMDLLHGGQANAFCLVASDSDYTRLATRIREEGLMVIGIGKRDTPIAFVSACNHFIFNEDLAEAEQARLRAVEEQAAQAAQAAKAVKPTRSSRRRPRKPMDAEPDAPAAAPAPEKNLEEALELLKEAYKKAPKNENWATLGCLGKALRRSDPGFDPRQYGHRSLLSLIQSFPKNFKMNVNNTKARRLQ